jgi:hypothetical protein
VTKHQLLEPILKDGLRATNFFNDRLLTAEALRTERDAYRARDALLGEAVGEGVVEGLWVSLSQADPQRRTLVVEAGLGVSRAGHPLHLPAAIDLAVTVATPDIAAGAGAFANCETVLTGATSLGSGLHLLTICPADGYEGQAPVAGAGQASGARGCGKRYVVEGVRFRLIYLSPDLFGGDADQITGLLGATDAASKSLLRNLVAHAVFGTEALRGLGGNLYGRAEDGLSLDDFGVLGALRRSGSSLRDGDLPIAVLHWTGSRVAMVDNWSARRMTMPGRRQTGWAAVQRSRQEALREAILLQFQEHVAALTAGPDALPESPRLTDLVRFLPPAGAIPVDGQSGLPFASLWQGLTRTPVLQIPPRRWRALLDIAMTEEPVAVTDDQTFSIYQDLANNTDPNARPKFIWFAGEAAACRFCVPLRLPGAAQPTRAAQPITSKSLQTLFGATADGYATVETYALARSRTVEREAAALMAVQIGAGQVSALARTLAVMAGDACCYRHARAVQAFAGLWDAQGDLLVRVAELRRWMRPAPETGVNTATTTGAAETPATNFGISAMRSVGEAAMRGETIGDIRLRAERLARLETLLGEDNGIFSVADNPRLWGASAPQDIGGMLQTLGNRLKDMKSRIDNDDLAGLTAKQQEINEDWANFLENQIDTG